MYTNLAVFTLLLTNWAPGPTCAFGLGGCSALVLGICCLDWRCRLQYQTLLARGDRLISSGLESGTVGNAVGVCRDESRDLVLRAKAVGFGWIR
jgi:hypothetical protein